jgi:hypothetical protein
VTDAAVSSGARRPKPYVRLALALALAAPFVVVPIALRRAATSAASSLGARASRAASALAPPSAELESTADPARAIGEIAPASFVYPTLASEALSSDAVQRHGRRTKRKPSRRGLLVRAATVERAIRMGGRPSGAPVPASGMRPAGLALAGVSRYGSALRDGDVLTKVGGTSAISEGAVIAAVAGAVRSGAHVITGVLWRGQDRYDVAVEIPRIGKPRADRR